MVLELEPELELELEIDDEKLLELSEEISTETL